MSTLQNLTVGQLRQVVAIKERIERLEGQLNSIAGSNGHARAASPKRRVMSAAAKARIGAAQRLRWAKKRGRAGASAAPAKKKGRRKVSAATKARLAAIAKARWAKVKASGKSAL
ncbi:MAG TPA: hypothetical protein VH619_14385 [Verrucomicrobiae bacterium]|nr:hypothetical protein [Verrucomicrobiae bacterium]